MSRPFEFTGRLRSFRYAFIGLWTMLRTQHNAWVHVAATAAVIATGLILRISASQWCLLVLAIMAVWTAEALNTAFEFLADVASPEFHPTVKHAKDIAAAAVLISAIGSVVIAALFSDRPLPTSSSDPEGGRVVTLPRGDDDAPSPGH
jgi:diacylglycerol kinase (ATP)